MDKIQVTTKGLTATYSKSLRQLSTKNASIICDYISAMKSETNLSDNYRRAVILTLGLFCRFSNDRSITRSHITLFLDSIRKPEDVDPLHKSIGTSNYYLVIPTRFFKWLYNPNMPAKTRPKPPVVENIAQLKRREISIYNPEDLWTESDDLLFVKFCPSKRMKCYHMVSRDFSARPHEILKLKISNIQFKTSGSFQYAEATLPSGKTGTRHVPIINSIPFVKDYLDHEHPQPNNLEAPFICGTGRSLGKHMRPGSLSNMYILLKKEYFPSLLLNPNVSQDDKDKIKELLRKPFNPYIRRHTALTEKAKNPKISHILDQHAGWVEGSRMRAKYVHWFSNVSNESILEAYGSDKKQSDILKPKQCPHCSEPNQPDSRFCANPKCRMTLTFDSYAETLQLEKEKDLKLEHLTRQVFDLNRHQEQLELDMVNITTGKGIVLPRKMSKEEEDELYQLVKEGKDIVKVGEGNYQARSLI